MAPPLIRRSMVFRLTTYSLEAALIEIKISVSMSHRMTGSPVSFRQGRGKAAHDYSAVGGFVFCSSKGNSLECRSILHKDIYFFSRRFSSLEIAPISPTLVGSGWRKKAT